MSLVEQLGGFTLFEFLDRVSAEELELWKAYNENRADKKHREDIDKRAINNTPKG